MNNPSLLTVIHTVLLKLPYMRIKNSVKHARIDDYIKTSVLLLFGIFVCGAEFFFFDRFWSILSTIPMGFILALPKLISFAGSFLFAFLAYSSIMTTLTALYRSNDMTVFLASPSPAWIYLLYKWFEIALRTGITFIALSIPPVFALFQWLDLSWDFMAAYSVCILSLSTIAVCVGMIFGMGLMSLFPEKRLHQSVAIIGLCIAASMIGGMRFLNIENLWSEMPEQSEIIQYFLQEDQGWMKYAPAALMSNALLPFLWNSSGGWMWTGINIISAIGSIAFTLWLGKKLFIIGWRKSQEQNDPAIQRKTKNTFQSNSTKHSKPFATMMKKDWIMLCRDPNVWTQLFMMVPLAAVYILNLAMLPLHVEGLQLLFAISNVGLIGMITAAVAARYLFPTVSREGRPVWIAANAPLSSMQFIMQKMIFACPPVILVSLTLLTASAWLLHLPNLFLVWTCFYGVGLVMMLCILAVSMGCCFPVFDYQHLMEVSLGKGALLYMFMALMMVGTLMTAAYYGINPSGNVDIFNHWFVLWFIVWMCITIITFLLGKRRMEILEVE